MRLVERVKNAYEAFFRSNPVPVTTPGGTGLGALTTSAWAPAVYGDYYAKSVLVYSAIKMRADAIARVPLLVYRQSGAEKVPLGPANEIQDVLDRVNPFWTRGDLWRASETYLGLWGEAFWVSSQDDRGRPEIWPLRPDRMRKVPDQKEYIKGFVHVAPGGKMTPFLPEEVVWMRYFNPMDEYAGLSPIAPLRLSADMAMDALRANRTNLLNDSSPGLFITSQHGNPTPEQAKDFYDRWEERFKGPANTRRPALLSSGMDVKGIGFSPKDMEYVQSLRWGVEDVARAYNVPKIMLHDLQDANYSNYRVARRSFWEDCIVPQLMFYQEEINEMLTLVSEDPNVFVAFDLTAIEALIEDEKAAAERHQIYLVNKVLTVNEVREELGREPVEWGDEPVEADPFGAPRSLEDRHARSLKLAVAKHRDEVEAEFLRRLTPLERSFEDIMVDLFRLQEKDMLRRLDEQRAAHPLLSSEDAVKEMLLDFGLEAVHGRAHSEAAIATLVPLSLDSPGNGNGSLERATTSTGLFDAEAWEEEFVRRGIPAFQKALTQAAQGQIALFGLGASFDVTRPIPRAWIRDRVKFWTGRVNETTAKLLMKELVAANEAGDGIAQIADRIRNVGKLNQQVRATTVARTEMVAASNEGHMEAYEEAKIEKKEWRAALDERTRVAHAEADGQVRALREEFDVGGEKLPAPGQGGSPGNVINCRCVVLPVIEA